MKKLIDTTKKPHIPYDGWQIKEVGTEEQKVTVDGYITSEQINFLSYLRQELYSSVRKI